MATVPTPTLWMPRGEVELLEACQAGLRSADLTGLNLDGADVEGASLTRCDLTGASLRGAVFRLGQLTYSKLHDADLEAPTSEP